MAKKVTMQQIANQLGVSKFVVSKALSGKGGVSETTKERVIQAASQLGYFTQKNVQFKQAKPEEAGLSQPGGKQSVIVLMPNIRFQNKESQYWGRILDGISAKLEEKGLGLLIVSEQGIDQFLDMMTPSRIMGMIGVGVVSSHVLLEAHRMGIPILLVDHEDPLIPTDTVFFNNYDCMLRITNHLIGIGHSRLIFIGNETFSRSFFDRWMGFRAAADDLHQAGASKDDLRLALQENQEFQYTAQIKEWAQQRMKKKALPTAMVCANDNIAYCAVQALMELGLKVPEDVSVTGFDNIEDSARFQPPLTTVNVPKETLGRRAVEKLVERVRREQEPSEKLLVSGDIILRGSSSERK
jgi:LacI family transcriptional regulator